MKRSGEYRNCLHCSKEFYCKPVVAKNPKRGKYCSNACQHKRRISMGIKLPSVCFHHNKRAKPKHCKGCGVDVTGSGKVYCSEECRAKTKSPFTHYRKTIKSKGLSSFKWHELCNLCGKTNKTYYVCIASKTCKECHNKKAKRIRTTKEGRQKYRNQYNAWRNKKRINDPAFKIHENIRTRIAMAIKSIKTYRTGSIENMFGCSRESLIAHFESKFTPKMTWENHGSYWHVDHIIPISSFDLTDPKQCKQANHWTNLQPLEAAANLAKSNTITKPQMSLMLNL
jgi:hypothetical protein